MRDVMLPDLGIYRLAVWGPPRENPGLRPKDRNLTCDYCFSVTALHPTPHGALHALVWASSLRVPCCHALAWGWGSVRKHHSAASRYLESGGFGMTSCGRSLRWNTRSIRRRRPLCTFSTCPRSCRTLQGAGRMAAARMCPSNASWPGRKSRTRSRGQLLKTLEDEGTRPVSCPPRPAGAQHTPP